MPLVRNTLSFGLGQKLARRKYFSRRPVQHDHLAGIAVAGALPVAAVLELGDGDLGEEAAIVGEPLQQRAGGGEAVLVGRIEMRIVERLDQLGQRDRVGSRGRR